MERHSQTATRPGVEGLASTFRSVKDSLQKTEWVHPGFGSCWKRVWCKEMVTPRKKGNALRFEKAGELKGIVGGWTKTVL